VTGRVSDSEQLRAAFGRLAREERERRGWTQQEVAERAGLRERQLRDIEQGHANSSFIAFDHLARLGLGMPFSTLIEAAEREVAPSSGNSVTTAPRGGERPAEVRR
jgi:transcriptional regulator with XRE-family HTH domain